MPKQRRGVCFISMKYGVPWIDPVHDIIERAADALDLVALRSDRSTSPFSKLGDQIRNQIDRSLLFVCESSSFSWYVAFELGYALSKGKHVILLIQKDRPTQLPDESNLEPIVGNEFQFLRYSLATRRDREALFQDLKERLKTNLGAVVQDLGRAASTLARQDQIPSPHGYVEPNVVWGGREMLAAQVWDEWQDYAGNQPIALVAPSGFGKSAFLVRFKERLMRGSKDPARPALPWWPLLVELGVEKSEIRSGWFGWLYQRALKEGHESQESQPFPLESVEPYVRSGFGYLLLDGLDEFGVTRKGADVANLLDKCAAAANQGLKVVLSCRSWFWRDRLAEEQRRHFLVAEIQRFDEHQAQEFIGPRSFKDLKLTPSQRNRDWIYSPLVLRFIRDAAIEEVDTRTDIYAAWCEAMLRNAIRCSEGLPTLEESRDFLMELAYSGARGRHQKLTSQHSREACREVFGTPDHFDPFHASLPILLIQRQDKEGTPYLTFFHQSIHEFFLAMRLKDEFQKALEMKPEEMGRLALAEAKLDYYASSIHGFLSERLEKKDFFRTLVAWFDKTGERLNLYPPPLLRNLVEHVGMTFRGSFEQEEDYRTAGVLLALVENSALSALVRYNAARALERIHPSSPKPYFDFTYDWGEASLEALGTIPDVHTIRGTYKKNPVPAPAEMVVRTYTEYDKFSSFRKTIVRRLMALLRGQPLNGLQGREDGCLELYFLKVNCSFALVRWFDFKDKPLEKTLFDLVRSERSAIVKENLLKLPRIGDSTSIGSKRKLGPPADV